MFEQVVGDGANLFINILAVIIGFVAALSYVDNIKVRKEEQEHKHEH
jgi:nucleoside permease NupC